MWVRARVRVRARVKVKVMVMAMVRVSLFRCAAPTDLRLGHLAIHSLGHLAIHHSSSFHLPIGRGGRASITWAHSSRSLTRPHHADQTVASSSRGLQLQAHLRVG